MILTQVGRRWIIKQFVSTGDGIHQWQDVWEICSLEMSLLVNCPSSRRPLQSSRGQSHWLGHLSLHLNLSLLHRSMCLGKFWTSFNSSLTPYLSHFTQNSFQHSLSLFFIVRVYLFTFCWWINSKKKTMINNWWCANTLHIWTPNWLTECVTKLWPKQSWSPSGQWHNYYFRGCTIKLHLSNNVFFSKKLLKWVCFLYD